MNMSSADIQDPVMHLHEDRSCRIATVVSVMIGLATIAVALRMFTRWLIATSWKLDDYGIMAALVSIQMGILMTVRFCVSTYMTQVLDYGLLVTQFVGIQYGAGKHAAHLDPETITQHLKVLMACELIYVTCLSTIKLSILALYYRLFSSLSRAFNIAVYVVAGLTVVGGATAFLIFAFQCTPFAYAFDKSIEGHCLDFNTIFVVTSAINVFINIVLLTLPLPVMWHLRLSRARKLAISGMFLLGGSVVVVSIVRIPVFMALSPTDITSTEYSVGTWSVVEVSIGIFCACLPVMRPLLRRFILRPRAVEASNSMHITCLPVSSIRNTSSEQQPDTDMSAKHWQQQQQQSCQNNNGHARPASPQRLNTNDSVMTIKQWRDPESMHPGDLWHVCNSSHGTSKAVRGGGVQPPTTTTTTTTTTRQLSYSLWPAD